MSLCNASGNIENLADLWNVDFIKLLNSLRSNNRMTKFIKQLLSKNKDTSEIATKLGVNAETLKKVIDRVH